MEEYTMKHAMKFAESEGGVIVTWHKLCNYLRHSENVCPKFFPFGWALLV